MTKEKIAGSLDEIGLLLDLKGENPFKVRAYVNGARIVKVWERSLEDLVSSAKEGKVKGIGAALAEKIETLVTTGSLPYLEELRAEFPEGLLDLFKVPGLGAKKVKILYNKLEIASLGELEYACLENRLVDLKGFGKKTQVNILDGIHRIAKFSDKYRIPTGLKAAESLIAALEATGELGRAQVAGSVRRRKETIKDVDILATSKAPEALMEAFTGHPDVQSVTGKGKTKSSVVLGSGLAADLRVVTEEQFAPALMYFTGSKEHNTVLRGIAKKKGLKLNEYGLFKGDEALALSTEEEIFGELGLAYVPPELREDRGEIQAAMKGQLPPLVETSDIKGILHAHTTYSDGSATVEQLATAVKEMGYSYLGLTDHSKSAAYAGGLREDDIKRQHEEIDRLNETLAPFRIFKGIESDILASGSLDYEDKVLEKFDFIIASIHSLFKMSQEEMTARILTAMESPYATILGHPTGRLLLSRDGYPLDVPRVLEKAAEVGMAVELNANPHRLDLDWRYHKLAKELGVPVPICPDAHSIQGVADVEYGVGVARKGGLGAEDVLNCLDAKGFAKFAGRRKA